MDDMALMPWTDDLVLGIAKLDEQHRWLVDRINALHDELGKSAPDIKAIGDLLETVLEYAMNHFVVEEEMFKRHGYAPTAEDLAAQSNFSAQLFDALDKVQAGDAAAGKNAATLLKDWLSGHIQTAGTSYAPVLKSKGEK
jgi:hemerythrin-like metal-binding protein